MDERLVMPIIDAAVEVLQGELGAKVGVGPIQTQRAPFISEAVTILIGLGGDVRGTVMLCMPETTALAVASKMAFEEMTVLDDMVKSAVAELTNMVSGRAALYLEERGLNSTISAPTVLTGVGSEISTVNGDRSVVPLETPCGAISLHIVAKTS